LKKLFKAAKKVLKSKIFRAIVAIAAIVYAPVLLKWAGGAFAKMIGVSAAVGKGIIVGGLIGYVGTGTLRGTLTGALSGAAFGYIGDITQGAHIVGKSFAHAATGGMMSAAQGGDFLSGFIGAGFAQFAGSLLPDMDPVAEGFARAVIGGTASKMGGGKFANGAITAAYGYLFNELGHKAYRGQSVCKGGCHGYDGTPGRPMTASEEALLNSGAAIIITAPLSGALAIISTSGRVIQLSLEGRAIANSMIAAGKVKTIQVAASARVLATDVAVTAVPIISNPAVQQNALDFLNGVADPGPPPPSPMGAFGWAINETLSK
jgi:hypothetical protein